MHFDFVILPCLLSKKSICFILVILISYFYSLSQSECSHHLSPVLILHVSLFFVFSHFFSHSPHPPHLNPLSVYLLSLFLSLPSQSLTSFLFCQCLFLVVSISLTFLCIFSHFPKPATLPLHNLKGCTHQAIKFTFVPGHCLFVVAYYSSRSFSVVLSRCQWREYC